jgi:raffinose/stachyose/melibiose transport system permease protein
MLRTTTRKTDFFPYAMCMPAILLFLIFVIVPFTVGLFTSFFRWDGFSDMEWNGLKNYGYVFRDELFWKAMKNTLVYAISVTAFKNILAFILASILVKNFRGKVFFRTAIYIPVTLSYIVAGILWTWIYNPTFGLLNGFLGSIRASGLIQGWLSDPKIALGSVIVVDVWKWLGYHTVLYIAGLQGISKDYYEAAELDGAGVFPKLRYVTIPMLNSTIVVNVLMSMTGAFVSNYDIVHIMTDGGPYHSTEVSLTYIMKEAFTNANFGKANAMSMILFLIVFVFGFLQLKLMSRDNYYN